MMKTVFLGAVCVIAMATAATATQFNIPSGDLKAALDAYAKQAGVSLIVSADAVKGARTGGVNADISADAALARILAGTGFITRKDSGAVVVMHDEHAALDDLPQIHMAAATAPTVPGVSLETVTVTAQKVKEDIQNVPIAVTALSAEQLQSQKIEGGPDLLKAMPNVTFSKNNFSGYNFSIRGIGTKAVSVTTDPGVAVDFNGTTLIRNRLFEQEYFDVERVEVLRGPQGTLYGRNATSGVINVISSPANLDDFSGSIKGEVGNYQSRRAVGMINVPLIDDKLAVRLAGSFTERDGYDIDLYNNQHVDGRNLWSGRLTVGFKPLEQLSGNFIWDHFNEDDDRSRTGKQLCTHDAGPDEIAGISLAPFPYFSRGHFTQGCLPGSLYDDKAFGTPNGLAIPFVFALQLINIGFCPEPRTPTCPFTQTPIIQNSDPYGNQTQSRNLRAIYSQIMPVYRAKADVYELNFDYNLSPALTVTSQTAYDNDKLYSSQDYNRFTTLPVISDSSVAVDPGGVTPSSFNLAHFSPGGIFCDPQLGCSNTIVGMDISQARSKQFSQEIRLQSSFSGPLNFNAGLDYTEYQTVEDYYVFFNAITMAAMTTINAAAILGGTDPSKYTLHPDCSALNADGTVPDGHLCTPIETNPIGSIQDTGHNYFLSRNPYKLSSGAAFGELYWQADPTIKVTAGLRYNDDRKTFTPIPSETLLTDPARLNAFPGPFTDLFYRGLALFSFASGAYPAMPDVHLQWREATGRFGVDWMPQLDFTDQSMFYAFYSRGYKGGGMNPPRIGLDYAELEAHGTELAPSAPPTFKPEFVNAIELGTKNTLLDGSLVLNGDTFFYDYKDYQVSKIVDRSADNENFNARIWGAEIESVWQVIPGLRLNANLGYLGTRLANGSKSIDVMNRTAGHSDWVVLKPAITLTSNCIAPAALVGKILAVDSVGDIDEAAAAATQALCPGGGSFGGTFRPGDPSGLPDAYGFTYDPRDYPQANYGAGFYTDVSGHELPNSPHFTVSLGAQYSYPFSESWLATLRSDYYWQDSQWARIYELPIDRLHAWQNVNVRLTFDKTDTGLSIELYVKNVFNSTPITDTFTNSDDSALTTNIFTLDPRLIGFSITKTF